MPTLRGSRPFLPPPQEVVTPREVCCFVVGGGGRGWVWEVVRGSCPTKGVVRCSPPVNVLLQNCWGREGGGHGKLSGVHGRPKLSVEVGGAGKAGEGSEEREGGGGWLEEDWLNLR